MSTWNDYINQPLSEVPFELLSLGMEVKSSPTNKLGTITKLSWDNGGATIEITWANGSTSMCWKFALKQVVFLGQP